MIVLESSSLDESSSFEGCTFPMTRTLVCWRGSCCRSERKLRSVERVGGILITWSTERGIRRGSPEEVVLTDCNSGEDRRVDIVSPGL